MSESGSNRSEPVCAECGFPLTVNEVLRRSVVCDLWLRPPNPTLREQVARAAATSWGYDWTTDSTEFHALGTGHDERPTKADFREAADAALEAVRTYLLSDEVVERAAREWFDGEYVAFAWDDPPQSVDLLKRWHGCRSKARIHARGILEAALAEDQ